MSALRARAARSGRGRRRWCRPASCPAAARSRIRRWCRHRHALAQATRAALVDEAFEVAVPEARMQRLRLGGQQRGNLRAELAREQLRKQLLLDLRLRRQHVHRADEVAPGILAPGVVLVDARIERDVLLLGDQVARRAGVIHGGVRRRTEHVFARLLLEDARRAAIVIDRQRLELFGHRRDREAAAGRNVADHGVDLIALHEVAEFGDDLRGRAGLVDVLGFDLGAAEAHRVVRRGRGAGIERLDHDLGAVAPGHAEWARGGPAQERHDADLDRRGRGRRRLLRGRERPGRERQSGSQTQHVDSFRNTSFIPVPPCSDNSGSPSIFLRLSKRDPDIIFNRFSEAAASDKIAKSPHVDP